MLGNLAVVVMYGPSVLVNETFRNLQFDQIRMAWFSLNSLFINIIYE